MSVVKTSTKFTHQQIHKYFL